MSPKTKERLKQILPVFWGPFAKRFILCYRSVVCLSVLSVLSACLSETIDVLRPNGWMDQDETWHGGRLRPRPHCVRWGPSSPSPKVHSPQFSANVCCGKTAVWIKMPLGTEAYLRTKWHPDPSSRFVTTDIDRKLRQLWSRRYCVTWGPMSPKKGDSSPPLCGPCIVAKRLDRSRCHLVRR